MAIFGRRHYQAIAKGLREVYISVNRPYEAEMLVDFALHLCEVFAKDNPNFKRERFLKACRMEEGI